MLMGGNWEALGATGKHWELYWGLLVRVLTVPGGFGGYWEALGVILRVTGKVLRVLGGYWELTGSPERLLGALGGFSQQPGGQRQG